MVCEKGHEYRDVPEPRKTAKLHVPDRLTRGELRSRRKKYTLERRRRITAKVIAHKTEDIAWLKKVSG